MNHDTETEHLFEGARLVIGKGKRDNGTFCVMSLVALLASERHSDQPRTASRVIREYAIRINDGMPDSERQRLKLFAPRIVGTSDDFDLGRAALVRQVVLHQVLPHIRENFCDGVLSPRYRTPLGGIARLPDLTAGFVGAAKGADSLRTARRLASHAAELLGYCGMAAAHAEARAWYWSTAIDLLDRMCDVGLHMRLRSHTAIESRRERITELQEHAFWRWRTRPLECQLSSTHPVSRNGMQPR